MRDHTRIFEIGSHCGGFGSGWLVMSCSSPDPPSYCSGASPELKLYQVFIFSVPVLFTFILLLLFYLLYLRRRRVNWQFLRMRAGRAEMPKASEMGIKKEVREMLPVVVFKESFLIRETQHFSEYHICALAYGRCAVCLGDYQSDERLQRIPPCGHTFHVDCIDHWLATNTTCPLCRVSLLPAAKSTATTNSLNNEGQGNREGETEIQSLEWHADGRVVEHNNVAEERERDCQNESFGCVREVGGSRHEGHALAASTVEAHGTAEAN